MFNHEIISSLFPLSVSLTFNYSRSYARFVSLVFKLVYTAYFFQTQSSGTPVPKIRRSDAIPSVRKRKVDKASLLGPHSSFHRSSQTALDVPRRPSPVESYGFRAPPIAFHWTKCQWVVSGQVGLHRGPRGMRIRKQEECQGDDLRQKRTQSVQRRE